MSATEVEAVNALYEAWSESLAQGNLRDHPVDPPEGGTYTGCAVQRPHTRFRCALIRRAVARERDLRTSFSAFPSESPCEAFTGDARFPCGGGRSTCRSRAATKPATSCFPLRCREDLEEHRVAECPFRPLPYGILGIRLPAPR
jgi:hypothetical protein